ncbi:MAG: peptidoglycan DD-metalloendopeptidase family protein [Gemmatimonadota bacterium]
MTLTDLRPRPDRLRASRRRPSARFFVGRRPVMAWAVAVAVALALLSGLRSRPVTPEDVKTVFVPTPPPPVVMSDTLRPGETLAEMLEDHGLSGAAAHRLIETIRPFKKPRTLRPGVVVYFSGAADEAPSRLYMELSRDERLGLEAGETGWDARYDSVPVRVDTLMLAGLIRTNLWESELSGDVGKLGDEEFAQLVWGLSSQIYAWKIDFSRDIQKGDGFRLAVERRVRPDGTVRSFRFLATEMRNRGRRLPAIPFLRPDGRLEYYDTEGESLRGVFLRAPLEFRITSGFARRRYHPILKRHRPHLGTDYGAPYGAPVQATAAGTVTRSGVWGGYGRMIEIRHTGGIRTRYAHLSRVRVRAGQRVRQGQVIGRVGATGLATAAHLHYEFLQNGRHRNPASIDLPSAPALEERYRPMFAEVTAAALDLLTRLPLPELPQGPPPADRRFAD